MLKDINKEANAMTIKQFLGCVSRDTELEGMWDKKKGEYWHPPDKPDCLIVRCKAVDQPEDGGYWFTTFSLAVIEEFDWEDLRLFTLGLREDPVYGVSRIVGYY